MSLDEVGGDTVDFDPSRDYLAEMTGEDKENPPSEAEILPAVDPRYEEGIVAAVQESTTTTPSPEDLLEIERLRGELLGSPAIVLSRPVESTSGVEDSIAALERLVERGRTDLSRRMNGEISGVELDRLDKEREQEMTAMRERILPAAPLSATGSGTESAAEAVQEESPESSSKILLSEGIERIYDACLTPEARARAVELSTILVSSFSENPKEITAIEQALSEVDFSAIDSKFGYEKVITDLMIRTKEIASGRSFDASMEDAQTIAQEILTEQQGSYYHGTNDVALSEILAEGELKGEDRGFEADLERIAQIAQIPKALSAVDTIGWYKINSEKTLFASGKSEESIGYAPRSPEWLDVMTSGAFAKRDYDGARKAVEGKINAAMHLTPEALKGGFQPITEEDAATIREVFEKYWQKYGSSRPVMLKISGVDAPIPPEKLLSIEASIVEAMRNPGASTSEMEDKFDPKRFTTSEVRTMISNYLMGKRGDTDKRIKGSIPKDQITSFDLPR